MTTTIFFAAIALVMLLWAVLNWTKPNQLEDEIDNWEAIDFRYRMHAHETKEVHGHAPNPMMWGQMYHPYEIMKQVYDLEERRRSSENKQKFYFVLLLIVCVLVTYSLRGLDLI